MISAGMGARGFGMGGEGWRWRSRGGRVCLEVQFISTPFKQSREDYWLPRRRATRPTSADRQPQPNTDAQGSALLRNNLFSPLNLRFIFLNLSSWLCSEGGSYTAMLSSTMDWRVFLLQSEPTGPTAGQ